MSRRLISVIGMQICSFGVAIRHVCTSTRVQQETREHFWVQTLGIRVWCVFLFKKSSSFYTTFGTRGICKQVTLHHGKAWCIWKPSSRVKRQCEVQFDWANRYAFIQFNCAGRYNVPIIPWSSSIWLRKGCLSSVTVGGTWSRDKRKGLDTDCQAKFSNKWRLTTRDGVTNLLGSRLLRLGLGSRGQVVEGSLDVVGGCTQKHDSH